MSAGSNPRVKKRKRTASISAKASANSEAIVTLFHKSIDLYHNQSNSAAKIGKERSAAIKRKTQSSVRRNRDFFAHMRRNGRHNMPPTRKRSHNNTFCNVAFDRWQSLPFCCLGSQHNTTHRDILFWKDASRSSNAPAVATRRVPVDCPQPRKRGV